MLEEHLLDLLEGKTGPIWVGEVPCDIAIRIGLKNYNVYLAQKTLIYILDSHPDIDCQALLSIPTALVHGIWFQERANPALVIASCYLEKPKARYQAVMKITKNNAGIWLSRFSRAHVNQTTSLLKQAIILRDQE